MGSLSPTQQVQDQAKVWISKVNLCRSKTALPCVRR